MDFAEPTELDQDPGFRPRAVRALPGRVLARARAGPLSGRVRCRPDRARLARGAHSRGIRRRWARDHRGERHPRRGQRLRLHCGCLPCADVRHGHAARHGSEEQKERFLPGIASGDVRLQAFGITEPTVGSDTTRIQTRAERVDGGYVISGQKIWTSRALHSDLMLLLARTTPLEEVEKRTEGLSVFVVDMRPAGAQLEIRPIKTMMNHATTRSSSTVSRFPRTRSSARRARGSATSWTR